MQEAHYILVLPLRLYGEMQLQAESSFPEECCGLMIGRFESSGTLMKKTVTSAKEMKNVFQNSEKYHRYTIDPKSYLREELEAEKNGEEIVGIYHSHPNAPAKPSEFDREHAWPTLSYLIMEARESRVINKASWVLNDDRSSFAVEELRLS